MNFLDTPLPDFRQELHLVHRGAWDSTFLKCHADEKEVLRMSEYLQDLELALRYYDETDMQVDFKSGNLFPLPFKAFQFGVPKGIRVSNVIVEAGLEQICKMCGIKLRRVKRLKGLEEFKYSISTYIVTQEL